MHGVGKERWFVYSAHLKIGRRHSTLAHIGMQWLGETDSLNVSIKVRILVSPCIVHDRNKPVRAICDDSHFHLPP